MHTIATGGRYPVLRSLALVNLAAAALLGVLGIITAYWATWGKQEIWWVFAPPGAMSGRVLLSLTVLGVTFFVVCGMVAVSELTKLLMDVAGSLRVIARGAPAPSESGDGRSEEEAAEMALIRGH